MSAWKTELIQVSSPGRVPLIAAPSHRALLTREAQLLPSLEGILLLSSTPQVENCPPFHPVRAGWLSSCPLSTNQEAEPWDLNPELTVMKPLPSTYLCCKGRRVLAEADRALRDT